MIFVTLMLPRGKGANAVKYLKELKAPKGIKIRDIFFAFGKYDTMIIFEAPDERTAMNFVMETGFATEYTMETMIVVPAEEITGKPK
ncbi:MAG: GYD domain-containing protein [Candidatus Bathyarchaeia archaeon]